jgi:valyl-tRNA synthetase
MKHWNIYSVIKEKLSEYTRLIDREKWTKILNDEQEIILQLLDYCQDYLDDADGVSLYPSVHILYSFPAGISYFETYVEMVKTAINSCDTNVPLGIIDCDIQYTKYCIIPIIGIISDSGNLEYNTKSKRVTQNNCRFDG